MKLRILAFLLALGASATVCTWTGNTDAEQDDLAEAPVQDELADSRLTFYWYSAAKSPAFLSDLDRWDRERRNCSQEDPRDSRPRPHPRHPRER